MSQILEWFGIGFIVFVLLPLFGLTLPGCNLSQESAVAAQAWGQAATQTVSELEEQGVDYRAELYGPMGVRMSWTPFGFVIENPGGYLKILIARGRGLGERPPDVWYGQGPIPASDGSGEQK